MESFLILVEDQQTVSTEVSRLIRNYKKDSSTRKTESYFKRIIRTLEDLWEKYKANHEQILNLQEYDKDHEYFTSKQFEGVQAAVTQYQQQFDNELTAIEPVAANRTGATPKMPAKSESLKMLEKKIDDMERLITGIIAHQGEQSDNYYRFKISSIDHLWAQITNLDDELSTKFDDPEKSIGYNRDKFLELEAVVPELVIKLSDKMSLIEHRQTIAPQSTVPLPKITIPKFDGDYSKWPQFYDMFMEIVDKQHISKVQRMFYLKTNVVGEAAKLIGHLSTTEHNYETAWRLLQDRYDNKRILVNTLIQRILDQSPGSASAAAVKNLHDTTQECLYALENLGITTKSWDPLLLPLLIAKLDRNTHLQYERSLENPRAVQKIEDFLKFLEGQFQTLEALGQKGKSTTASKTCASAVSAQDQKTSTCSFCMKPNHQIFKCIKFRNQNLSERLKHVQNHKLCVNCLSSYHAIDQCSWNGCRKCGKKQHWLLHKDTKPEVKNVETNGKRADTATVSTSLMSTKNPQSRGYVLLSTAIVKLVGINGQEKDCRAIIDSGSQLNFISERIVKQLGLKLQPTKMNIQGIGANSTTTHHRINLEMRSKTSGFTSRLEAFVLPQIISSQPSKFIKTSDWQIPDNIKLADPNFNRPDKIDVLLGAEYFTQLLSVGQIKLGAELPTIQNTVLGWVVSGKVHEASAINTTCGVCTDDELDESIERFWKIEDITSEDKTPSLDDRQCEEHFANTTTRNEQGRFMVKIPFRENPRTLGESHGLAYSRFLALERRLQKNPAVKLQYEQFMNEYASLGHMTEVNINSVTAPRYIIPHHCVLKPDSSSTKLRVVFDASAKTSSGHSLNDLSYTGPTVQSELFAILLRFRLPRFVFTTDIEKMYRQILMHPDDRRFQVILWRNSPAEALRYFQLNTVTYGTRSAPYLATKCLTSLATENYAKYPLGAAFLNECFYVDDGIGGANSLSIAREIQNQVTTILKTAGFTLRKWCANHPQLLNGIPTQDQEINLDFANDNKESIKTLGLIWRPHSDVLGIKVHQGSNKKITKRTVLSDVAKLFDPLGILAPVIVRAKIFIQKLWALKLTWDEALPMEMYTKWNNFRENLVALEELHIPRHIFSEETPKSIQIHIFTDASENAYGAAAYLRATYDSTIVTLKLVCAKSRIAPLKRLTLPRLELCAAVLGAQLSSRVKRDLKLKESPIYYWSDSEIVLSWINSCSSSFHTFVGNRISTIQNLTNSDQWHHINSKENPADILSRGAAPQDLHKATIWFHGPRFLYSNESLWPSSICNKPLTPTNLERKQNAPFALITAQDENILSNINHRNSFNTLQHTIGYVLRFIHHTRRINQHSEKFLTPIELDDALTVIIKTIQYAELKEEIQHITKYKELKKASSLNNLTPFLDTNGVLRVGGRLQASSLPYDAKHQMILPYNNSITKLIFERTHVENKHCGAQALLSIIRQRFWPIKGKIIARSTVQHCVRCTRAKPQLLSQIMGNLPEKRVTPARPFINAGVDYCGPFRVHYKIRGKRPHKAYVAIFCCFATKAVHMEVVSDLTTNAFIEALNRFVSRRGHCQNLYCDNATNFVGANNELKDLSEAIYSDAGKGNIMTACSNQGIKFNFIPPRAPHFGGLWEAAVKSSKNLLVRSVASENLTYEELETVIIGIEAILNSRPLTPLSNDPNDMAALTPGHFLIGDSLKAHVDSRAVEEKRTLSSRWRLLSHLKHQFWVRWTNDYLQELQQKHKWKQQSQNIKIGDMVIIKEDNTPVLNWPLGRITKIYKGDDDIVRVVDVKTASGILKRTIHRLAPLPVDDNPQTYEEPTTSNKSLSESREEKSSLPKRRKMSTHSPVLGIFIMMLLLPLIWTKQIENIQFNSGIGLYFEGIGSIQTSHTEWHLISYYDLKPYWEETAALANGTKALRQLCQKLTNFKNCRDVVISFEHLERAISQDNTVLHPNKRMRSKRGAINAVGNVLNSLFGVLDSQYAEGMSQTIERVKGNEHHLLELLRNQTSIIDATINVYKQDELTIKQKFKGLDFQLNEIASTVNLIKDQNQQTSLFEAFTALTTQLTLIASNLQRIQALILNVLADSYHGKINPSLLSPTQLQNELIKIRNHLPSSLQLPGEGLHLYKFIKVEGALTENHVVFRMSIPLCDHELLHLYKPYPIPAVVNNSMVAITPCSEFLAINSHRDQYSPIDPLILRTCISTGVSNYLCSNMQSLLTKDSATCSCEMHLLNNEHQTDCNIQKLNNTTFWAQLGNTNRWLYSELHSSRITTVCGEEVDQLTISGSGILKVQRNCILKHPSIIIKGHEVYTTKTLMSYPKIGNLFNITVPAQLQHIGTNPMQYESQIANLTKLHEQLLQQQTSSLPNDIPILQYHNTAIGYVALALIISVIIYTTYQVKRKIYVQSTNAINDVAVETPSGDQAENPTDGQRSRYAFII